MEKKAYKEGTNVFAKVMPLKLFPQERKKQPPIEEKHRISATI